METLQVLGKQIEFDPSQQYLEAFHGKIKEFDPHELEKDAKMQTEMERPDYIGYLYGMRLIHIYQTLIQGSLIAASGHDERVIGDLPDEHRPGLENTASLMKIVLEQTRLASEGVQRHAGIFERFKAGEFIDLPGPL
ncbi:hypothetical protein ACFL1B_06235 [Nanoarchaeota archaeon]